MKAKKTLTLILFSVFIITAFSSTAFGAGYTVQQVIIPYGSINPTSGYWTGLAINNQSSSLRTFNIEVYDETGAQIAYRNCIVIPAMGTKTDLLENFFTTAVSGRMSVYITTNSTSTDRFETTMFMGNTGKNNPGFAFQTYRSENHVVMDLLMCKTIPGL